MTIFRAKLYFSARKNITMVPTFYKPTHALNQNTVISVYNTNRDLIVYPLPKDSLPFPSKAGDDVE